MRWPRFIIAVFDALRRDMITPELAPNLRRFLDEGSDFPRSRCVFPSVTRVNATALACGAAPGATGVIANKFFDPNIFNDKLLHTGQYDDIHAAEAAYNGRFVETPSLGEILADNGMKVAVVSTGSAGTTHLLNPRAADLGQVTLCLSDWRESTPRAYADAILERFGPIPAAAKPNIARIELQMRIILEAVLPETEPDALMIWFSDPDATYHHCGIGSPESEAAIRNVDEQFGRLLQAWRSQADADRCRIFVCSDHGQVTSRERVFVKQSMREAGIEIGSSFTETRGVAGTTSYYGAIRIRDGELRTMKRVADWLNEQAWCAHVFTPAGGDGLQGVAPGTLDRSLLMVEHARAPEVYYTMRADHALNQWGWRGTCYFDSNEYPVGGGTHGGLHEVEMNNLLAVQGAGFKQAYSSTWSASHTDVVPTILHMLGIAPPSTITGRVLTEALTPGREPDAPQSVDCEVETGRQRQVLRLWRVGATTYIDQGWRDDS
ncbi:MAG: alkaline phosphatase family protein [Burkholderiales bacterium]